MKFARKHGPWIVAAAAAAAFAAAPAARPAPAVARGAPRRFLVHFEDVVRNEGTSPLRAVACDMLLPVDAPRQRVRWVRLSPHGWELHDDAHGGTVATARLAEIPPGGAACFSWIASVELAAEDHAPAELPRADPPAEAARYLGDAPRFSVRSAEVRAAAAEARRTARGASPRALAESAARVVRSRVAFELAGGWDPAPAVLRRGSGSCSESVFAFVAVCRSLGLPARWAGGTMLRAGPQGRAEDATFHRIAEVWLPGHGWWPVETQGARGPRPQGETPGADRAAPRALPRTFLVLARGDGAGADGLGAAYHARERWLPRETWGEERPRPATSKRAWWIAGDAEAGPAQDVPTFAACEQWACDARGFGPPIDLAGRPVGPAPAERPDAGAVAERLLAAAHPEGLRLAAEAYRDDPAALRALAAAHCEGALADDFLAAASAAPATFEAWWAAVGGRVAPSAPGRLALAQ